MKRIDRLVITSFIPPFIVAFSIAVFVLLMQMLWLYIDDIAGKGLGIFAIVELLFYRSVSLVPLALPLGVLIASVMVMGGLAEHYELSSLKSAGVSLVRVMRAVMFFGVVSMFFSVYCSNTLIPQANLKFGSRMFDIQQKKPALRLEAGAFNYDFRGFTIHIGWKGKDGVLIRDILIYDHTRSNSGEFTQITAEEGEMFTSPDGKVFVMRLRNGHQYVEQGFNQSSDADYPYLRTAFREWVKVFDLSEFELVRTNEELFKNNRSMMSAQQLAVAVDSIEVKIDQRRVDVSNYLANYISIMELDSTYLLPPPEEAGDQSNIEVIQAQQRRAGGRVPARLVGDSLEVFQSFYATLTRTDQDQLLNKAKTFARSVLNQAEAANRTLDRMMESRVKHIYDLHMKYSMAVVCFIFVLIGAPMGAIVRKGGFGFPILVSIIFFMLFVILTIMCRKIAETFVLTPVAAAWIPCAILLPVGLLLTNRAMNDSRVIDPDRVLSWLRRRFKKHKNPQDDGPLDTPPVL